MFDCIGQRLRAYAEKDGRGYPDWAVRYRPIVRRLRTARLAGQRILEVGANTAGFARFAHTRTIVIDVNIDHLHEARRTQEILAVAADATALPFSERTFDVCIEIDTIEHVPPTLRQAAVTEVVRVMRSSGTAVIAFPSGTSTTEAERRIHGEYKGLAGRSIPWLDEHAALGLPNAEEVSHWCAKAAGTGRHVRIGKNANLTLWTWTWRVLMCNWPGRGNAGFQALLRFVTPLLCRIHIGTCYRTVVWIKPTDKPATQL